MLDTAISLNAIPLNNDTVTPGFLGFGFFLALGAATFLLLRSMNKRLRKVQALRAAELEKQERERAEKDEEEKTANGARGE
ncbi:MAG: hypothetical protein IRY90_02910 [Actinomadura rubrobrunea]|nr:hypothetical protein [Actinomadura rubrobrunea]